MKCILVDDDPVVRKFLNRVVSNNKSVEILGECEDGKEAYQFISKNDLDLVFLDIEMPGMSGLELIDSLKNVPQVIIVSSDATYAAESYNYNVTDFIVKPITQERVDLAIQKAHEINSSVTFYKKNRSFIFVKDGTIIKKIRLNEIHWIEALGDYVAINLTSGKKVTVLSTMKSMEAKLPDSFVRIHRSFIIPVEQIEEIEDNTVVLGDKLLPISKRYKEGFMKELELL